jgi:hypothetical protein
MHRSPWCHGQVLWSCYLVAFHWETQATFSTLLDPFRNVISEWRTLQNKSGEIYGQKKVEKVEKVENLKVEKWKKFW